ncbi:hypothetical protein PRNP1_008145 [Phytophthora ramorum]
MSLLQPEATDAGEEVPGVYRSLNFRSLQDPYSNRGGDTMTSRYSTLRAENLETMLNGGLERFFKKYNHLSRKTNLQLPTPEVRFENLSFSVQVPAEAGAYGTVGSHLAQIFTPWQKVPMATKQALHPMSGIIKPGSMTLILANPGAGKSTFLKALAGRGHAYANGKVPTKDLAVSSEDFNNLFCQSSIYKKTHEAISKGFNEHQFENAEDFQKAKSVANLARSKQKSEFGLAFSSKFLDSFSISQGTEYVWFGIGVLVAYYLFFTTLNGLALHFIRYEKYKGVSVKAMTDNASEEDNVYVEVRTPGAGDVVQTKARGAGLPFTPSNLCIKDLEYFVTLPSGVEKQLLCGITAHFEPGRMVALMGATGAGKTTLMDDYSFEYKNSELYKSNREHTLQLAQFGDNQDVISVPSGNTTTNMTVAVYIEKTYDFRPERKYNFMAGLLVIWVVLQVAIYLTFKYVSHLKR